MSQVGSFGVNYKKAFQGLDVYGFTGSLPATVGTVGSLPEGDFVLETKYSSIMNPYSFEVDNTRLIQKIKINLI